ncbi:hypothetical protein D1BOALGB6SA_5008 [Olavius sp. associated proteobacterium Delta 1]|nr:hypothetical protein D1BOALGB6SA_5008 [Olavius sp. associated proteobacterium Delta 1]
MPLHVGNMKFAATFFSIITFKNNSIASSLQYFIGLHIILCYVNFQIYLKLVFFNT